MLSPLSWSGLFNQPLFAESARKQQKHCILLWLCGAPSQFETWDPKPASIYSGPFRSIPTPIPGVHFSELMPRTASIAGKLSVVRSMKTRPNEHFQAIDLLNRGADPRAPFIRPTLGAVLGSSSANSTVRYPISFCSTPAPKGTSSKRSKREIGRAGWEPNTDPSAPEANSKFLMSTGWPT